MPKILHGAEDSKRLVFFCPGCECGHEVYTGDGTHPRWGFNGDDERPTLTPSILIRTGHHADGQRPCWCDYNREHPEEPVHCKCGVCHSFVTEGKIQFLSDSTHALAGQTVDLPDFPCEQVEQHQP